MTKLQSEHDGAITERNATNAGRDRLQTKCQALTATIQRQESELEQARKANEQLTFEMVTLKEKVYLFGNEEEVAALRIHRIQVEAACEIEQAQDESESKVKAILSDVKETQSKTNEATEAFHSQRSVQIVKTLRGALKKYPNFTRRGAGNVGRTFDDFRHELSLLPESVHYEVDRVEQEEHLAANAPDDSFEDMAPGAGYEDEDESPLFMSTTDRHDDMNY